MSLDQHNPGMTSIEGICFAEEGGVNVNTLFHASTVFNLALQPRVTLY